MDATVATYIHNSSLTLDNILGPLSLIIFVIFGIRQARYHWIRYQIAAMSMDAEEDLVREYHRARKGVKVKADADDASHAAVQEALRLLREHRRTLEGRRNGGAP